jgi:hypothetical protein
MTALGAARADNATATTRLHANEKTMGALTTHDGRLVGTFHLLPRESAKNLKLNQFFDRFVNSNRVFKDWTAQSRGVFSAPLGLWITLR